MKMFLAASVACLAASIHTALWEHFSCARDLSADALLMVALWIVFSVGVPKVRKETSHESNRRTTAVYRCGTGV